MSTAHDVLKRAQAAGVSVMVDGEQLRLKANSEPPRELLEELRAHKPALLRLLVQPDEAEIPDAAESISGWLVAMDRLPKACGPHGQRLKTLTTDFAMGPWSAAAVQHGWTDVQLFALDGGLIPEMSRRALHFRAMAWDFISLINGRGQYEEWPRQEMVDAVPWWEDEQCVARFH